MESAQRHFGAFDGRFLGVSLTFGSERIARLITDVAYADQQDAGHLLAQPRERAVESINALSAIPHEMRHFHDFLLAPLSALAMQARLDAFFHTMQFLAMVLRQTWGAANCIPVPIPRWCRKSDSERAQLVEAWKAWSPESDFRVPALPHVTDESQLRGIPGGARAMDEKVAAELVLRIAGSYQVLRTLVTRPVGTARVVDFQPLHVHEASAMFVQLQEIWTSLGAEAAQLIVDELNRDVRFPYAVLYRFLHDMATTPPAGHVGAAVVAWAQLGDPQLGIVEASPVTRIARLVRHLQEVGMPDPDASPAELLPQWDTAVGGSSTAAALRHSLDVDQAYLAKLERLAETARRVVNTEAMDRTFRDLIAFYGDFARARRHMVETFLDDPDRYIHPYFYLDNAACWSRPPLKYVYSGTAYPRLDEVRRTGAWVQLSAETAAGEPIAVVIGPRVTLPGVPHIDPKAAFGFLSWFTLTDVLFAEFMRDVEDHEYEIALQVAREELDGVRLVSVLD
jgi:hypothetical protein